MCCWVKWRTIIVGPVHRLVTTATTVDESLKGKKQYGYMFTENVCAGNCALLLIILAVVQHCLVLDICVRMRSVQWTYRKRAR